MSPKHVSTVNFLRKINDELFFRIYGGNFAYQRDLALLAKYVQIATEINAHGLAGRLRITEMLLHIVSGDFVRAFQAVEMSILDYERETDLTIKAENLGCYSNRAEMYHMLGDNQTAINQFEQVLHRIDNDPLYQSAADTYYFYMIIGICNLELERYDTAEALFVQVLACDQANEPHYATAIADSYRGLSECYLQRDDFEKARTTAQLAQEIAQRTNEAIQLFYAYTALAHIAEKATMPGLQSADEYYQAAIATADKIGTDTLRALAFLHEARYHQRHTSSDKRREFTRRATALLSETTRPTFEAELSRLLV